MNMLKGSLFVFVQSYKRQMLWFWAILVAIMLLAYIAIEVFQSNVRIILSISIPIYIFTWIIGSKFLTNTFNYYLRFGMSRGRYMLILGLLFFLISLFNAMLSGLLHELFSVLVGDMLNNQIIVIHPLYVFDSTLPFQFIVLTDFFILLLCIVSGLLTNYMFYRFGIAGGYSLTGIIVLALIVAVPLEWYGELYDWLLQTSLVMFCGGIAIISVLLYSLLAMGVRKLSAVQV